MNLSREEILQIVHFTVQQLFDKNGEKNDKKFADIEQRLADLNLKRVREARQSMSVQPLLTQRSKSYTDSTDPAKNLGETGDFYEKNDGAGVITEKFTKEDGRWVSLGTYATAASGTSLVIAMTGGPHTDYVSMGGVLDDSNQLYNIPGGYVAGTLVAYFQGQASFKGEGITETNPATGDFTFTLFTPNPGQYVAARYEAA